MNKSIVRVPMFVAALCALALGAQAQQRTARRGGSLNSLSLVSNADPAMSAGAGWQLFAPEGAGFSVLVPGTPEEASRHGRENGMTPAQFLSYHLTADGLKYEFGRTGQLPLEIAGKPDFGAKFFAHNAEGMLFALQSENPALKFRLVGERKVTAVGYEGREYEFAAPGVRSLARVYLIDRALFALALSGAEAKLTDDSARKFFDSFNPQ